MSWKIQTGKGKGSYKTLYTIPDDQPLRAERAYVSILTHSGHKKRLVDHSGRVVRRFISKRGL